MQLLYGTYNPAKLSVMRRWIAGLDVALVGLSELPNPPEDAAETGSNPRDNARIKAMAYRDATGMTTLAADSGLYLEGLPDERQPAEHPRRMLGTRMGDEEMIAYYAGLAASLGGRAVARYRNALCIAFADGRIEEIFDDTVASEPFFLVDTPHPKRVEGFPLDSISVEIQSGAYYFDLEEGRADSDLAQGNGYRAFIRKALRL